MYFSVTFRSGAESRNTWLDWRLIPDTPPVVPPPEPVTNMVDIPGRQEGPIDMSKYPFGRLVYQRITGSWNFLREPDGHEDRVQFYESIRGWLHGRECRVLLEEDMDHYYVGRLTVGPPSTGRGPQQITIGFNLMPVRYNAADDSKDTSWVSNWQE